MKLNIVVALMSIFYITNVNAQSTLSIKCLNNFVANFEVNNGGKFKEVSDGEMRYVMLNDTLAIKTKSKPPDMMKVEGEPRFVWRPEKNTKEGHMIFDVVSVGRAKTNVTVCPNIFLELPFYVNQPPKTLAQTISRSISLPLREAMEIDLSEMVTDPEGDVLTAKWIIQIPQFPTTIPGLKIRLPSNWVPQQGTTFGNGRIQVSDGNGNSVDIELTINYSTAPAPPTFNLCNNGTSGCDYPEIISEGSNAVDLGIFATDPVTGRKVALQIDGPAYNIEINNSQGQIKWTPGYSLVDDNKPDEVKIYSVTFRAITQTMPVQESLQLFRFKVKNKSNSRLGKTYDSLLRTSDSLKNTLKIKFCERGKIIDENSYRIGLNEEVKRNIGNAAGIATGVAGLFSGGVAVPIAGVLNTVKTGLVSSPNGKQEKLISQISLFQSFVQQTASIFKNFETSYPSELSYVDRDRLTPDNINRMSANYKELDATVASVSLSLNSLTPLFRPKRTPMPGLPSCSTP